MAMYQFTLEMEVDNIHELWLAAFTHLVGVDGLDPEEAKELIGRESAEADLVACLISILDPGSLPGCSIYGSSAEILEVPHGCRVPE